MKNTIGTEEDFQKIRDETIPVVIPAGRIATYEFNDNIQASAEVNCQYKYRRATIKIKEKELYGMKVFQIRWMLIHEICHIRLGAQKDVFSLIQQDIGNLIRSTMFDHMLYVEEQMCEELAMKFHKAHRPEEFDENAYNFGLSFIKQPPGSTTSQASRTSE